MLKDFTRKMDIVSEEMKNLRKDTETLKKYQVETLELKDLIYEIFKNSQHEINRKLDGGGRIKITD